MNSLCILKMGSTLPEIAARLGDFEDWICQGMKIAREEVRIVDVVSGDALPNPESLSGVVITGSSAMVSEREAWSEAAARWIPYVIEAGRPLLGICYGHQLIAHALGGVVADNPRGREIGTTQVCLAGAWSQDPLFRVLPPEFVAQVSHVQSVIQLPPGADLQGTSPGDPHQAFSMGPNIWGVQFHPEFDAEIVRGYIAGRREALESEGLDPERLTREARDGAGGAMLLERFYEIVRRDGEGSRGPGTGGRS